MYEEFSYDQNGKEFCCSRERVSKKTYEEFAMAHLLKRLDEEIKELKQAISAGDWENSKQECADVSNVTDYIFEQLTSGAIQI